MAELSGFKSATLTANGGACAAVSTANEVVTWGDPPSGQPALTDAVSIQTNYFAMVALKSDRTVVAWGSSSYGLLTIPAGLSDVVQIALGDNHCLALKADGTVVGWGRDDSGQASPPGGLTDVVQVVAAGNASMALKSDGSIVTWGSNSNFQLIVPSGIGPAKQIALGNEHGMALLVDGTVEVWGIGSQGQNSVPASVSSPDAIAAGRYYCMALQNGGVIYWGSTSYGLNSPPASTTSGVVAIANCPNASQAMCLLDDGTPVVWGQDIAGETSPPAGLTALAPGVPPTEGTITASVPFSALFQGEQVQNPGEITASVDFTASFTGFDNWIDRLDPIQLQELYLLTITGAANGLNDLDLSISSWQATNQAGTRQSYLQAVIPAAVDLIDEIEARQDGELILKKGFRFSDGTVRAEEILRSNFDTFRYDRGPSSFSVTVSGYLGGKQSQNASRTLKGVRSINLTNGKYRVRADIDLFLQPGMTVTADNVTLKADFINYYVSDADKFCEVSER
ncbi:RCC1 domain-containing protein [Marinobacter sp.]|uniref:RCC1 domain-containing protein n=1 Tax=Marinobacter sp. TaxID=50741 RepID=UPI0035C7601A